MLGDTESEESWTEFFSWLKARGFRGVDLVVSDDHGSLAIHSSSVLGCSVAKVL